MSDNKKFILPALPYNANDLAPTISSQTVDLHYGKHHQAYFNMLNTFAEGTKFMDMDLDAVVVIGSIIKGETPHFDFISQAVANGVKDLNILFDIPFVFCVLTDLNWDQAMSRSGGEVGNKGEESAVAAITLIKNYTY